MSLMIAPYQPKITWLKGTDNKILDMISRMLMVTNDTKLIPRHDWLKCKIVAYPVYWNLVVDIMQIHGINRSDTF